MYFEARHVFGMLLSASSHLGISLQLVFVFCVCEILEKGEWSFRGWGLCKFCCCKTLGSLRYEYGVVWVPYCVCAHMQSISKLLATGFAPRFASRWDNAAKIMLWVQVELRWNFISRIYKLVPKHWLKPKIDKMRQQDESLIRIEPSAWDELKTQTENRETQIEIRAYPKGHKRSCISQARIAEQQDANATSPVIADELKSIVNAACFKAM